MVVDKGGRSEVLNGSSIVKVISVIYSINKWSKSVIHSNRHSIISHIVMWDNRYTLFRFSLFWDLFDSFYFLLAFHSLPPTSPSFQTLQFRNLLWPKHHRLRVQFPFLLNVQTVQYYFIITPCHSSNRRVRGDIKINPLFM